MLTRKAKTYTIIQKQFSKVLYLINQTEILNERLLILGLSKKLVDVIFVMGSSDPNGATTLTKEKKLVNDIIDKPKDGFVKYGVVELDPTGTVKVPLGDYRDEKELKENVKKIPFKERNSLDEGIKSGGKEFDKNGRPKARKIMVVFIDGNDDSTKDQLDKVAKPLKKKNVKIIPVVLGENVDEEKLKPLLGKKKKPKKEKDPRKLAEEVAEEIFNGKNYYCLYLIHFLRYKVKHLFFLFGQIHVLVQNV